MLQFHHALAFLVDDAYHSNSIICIFAAQVCMAICVPLVNAINACNHQLYQQHCPNSNDDINTEFSLPLMIFQPCQCLTVPLLSRIESCSFITMGRGGVKVQIQNVTVSVTVTCAF